jgi:hypothetical protein
MFPTFFRVVHMKLPLSARDLLRRVLKEHLDTPAHYTPEQIDKLDKPQLLRLARKVGVDVAAIIEQATREGKWPESYYEAVEAEAHRHALKHPGFMGATEFEIAFEALGVKCVRKARVTWERTPHWPYYDLHKRSVVTMPAGGGMGLEIWAIPDEIAWRPTPKGSWKKSKGEPAWVKVNALLDEGILPSTVWEALEERIEQRCQTEDLRRRAEYGAGGQENVERPGHE